MSATDPGERTTKWLPINRLILDKENPRLPEQFHGQPQSEILRYLYEQGALEELAYSYQDNGFFPQEPLLVVREGAEDTYTVVEGNRRLAALMILHGTPEAGDIEFVGLELSTERLKQLREIPCIFVADRNQISAYIGFRHIGGLKTWPPEAKARYLLAEVNRLIREGLTDPFRELGRRVGSNAQGVRNPYLAIRILIYARQEFGINVAYVQDHRFGVWLRCMNSADIRSYIGLKQARTYLEIEEALTEINRDGLAEVLRDLESGEGRNRAVLGDSRDVTIYGRALVDERARATLRKTGDLSLARQVVEELDLEARAQRLVRSLALFLETLQRAPIADMSSSLLQATEELSRLARSARAIVKGGVDERDYDA
ncbi:MAG: ParB/Srx family N-terminal domain-containing protein [Bryobacterales bacterium]|nr:ParB/Srx family N-terminal domain-containing protein [Bryobacterales bacterium]